MNCLIFDPVTKQQEAGGEELLDRWAGDEKALIWVDLTGSFTDGDVELLGRHFHLHPLAIQDARRDRHPPKLEAFEDHTFLLFKGLAMDSSDINFSTIQLALFVGERFLVTRSSDRSVSKEQLRKELEEDSTRFAEGPDALAARLMRIFIGRYLRILLQLEPRLDELDKGLLQQTDDAVLAELGNYKTALKKLRRIFVYHQQILGTLNDKSFPGFTAKRKHELTDVFEQQERASSLTLLYYELASDLIDGYLSLSSHRLNQIMKVLTIITAVFVPLGFLAGIYGMNFENMPELKSSAGYFILLGVMAGVATVLLLAFRKRGWL